MSRRMNWERVSHIALIATSVTAAALDTLAQHMPAAPWISVATALIASLRLAFGAKSTAAITKE